MMAAIPLLFVLLIVLLIANLWIGQALKRYLKEKHPTLFAELYGDGKFGSTSINQQLKSTSFLLRKKYKEQTDVELISLFNLQRIFWIAYAVVFVVLFAAFNWQIILHARH
jgi:hypothetical protein